MYEPDERYDIVEEALQDTKRGPIRPSRKLTTMVGLAFLWVVLDLAFLGYIFVSGLTLGALTTLMVFTFVAPTLGVTLFFLGYSRRYRFVLGKTVERSGLVVLGVAILNIVACFILRGTL
ncbi:MAG: hypothetical protein H9W81_10085 [Enterococcus sp.]|nr:hypothetical protein [Enterococcus sp.]